MRVLMMLVPDDEAAVKEGAAVLGIEPFVAAYYVLRDGGAEVVPASADGDFSWMQAISGEREEMSAGMLRFKADRQTREALTDTILLDHAYADEFDAALCIGTPGPNRRQKHGSLAALIAAFLRAGKPVAVVPSDVDLANGITDGLLITGNAAVTVAHALLGAFDDRPFGSEGTDA